MVDLELFRIEDASVTSLKVLSQEEVDIIKADCSKLMTFQKHHALIEYVIYNYSCLYEFLIKTTTEVSETNINDFGYPFHNFYLEMNAVLLNFLISCRTFLDHIETNIKRNTSQDDGRLTYFKEIAANEFDSKFSYKFMAKLRNFVQHSGMPPLSYEIKKSYIEEDTLTTHLTLMFDRDELLKEYDSWGALVKPQLENQNSKFPALQLINEYLYSLIKIYISLTARYDFEEILDVKNKLLHLINEKDGFLYNNYATGTISPTKEGVDLKLSAIPISLLKKVDHFEHLRTLLDKNKDKSFIDYHDLDDAIK